MFSIPSITAFVPRSCKCPAHGPRRPPANLCVDPSHHARALRKQAIHLLRLRQANRFYTASRPLLPSGLLSPTMPTSGSARHSHDYRADDVSAAAHADPNTKVRRAHTRRTAVRCGVLSPVEEACEDECGDDDVELTADQRRTVARLSRLSYTIAHVQAPNDLTHEECEYMRIVDVQTAMVLLDRVRRPAGGLEVPAGRRAGFLLHDLLRICAGPEMRGHSVLRARATDACNAFLREHPVRVRGAVRRIVAELGAADESAVRRVLLAAEPYPLAALVELCTEEDRVALGKELEALVAEYLRTQGIDPTV